MVLEFISQKEIVLLSAEIQKTILFFSFKDNFPNTMIPILNKSGADTGSYINNLL